MTELNYKKELIERFEIGLEFNEFNRFEFNGQKTFELSKSFNF